MLALKDDAALLMPMATKTLQTTVKATNTPVTPRGRDFGGDGCGAGGGGLCTVCVGCSIPTSDGRCHGVETVAVKV